jgi:hypothetical protein
MEVVPATGQAICSCCWKTIPHKPLGVQQVSITLGTKHWFYHPSCFKNEYEGFLKKLEKL